MGSPELPKGFTVWLPCRNASVGGNVVVDVGSTLAQAGGRQSVHGTLWHGHKHSGWYGYAAVAGGVGAEDRGGLVGVGYMCSVGGAP